MSRKLLLDVFNAVAQAGAMTTRRVIQTYGPKPNWQYLIDHRRLKEYQTVYGPVLALGARGRELDRNKSADDRWGNWSYLAGPGTVADRAYQNDAIALLTARGYQVKRHDYKRAGQVGAAARGHRKHTDQILRTVMQVPEPRLRALLAGWGDDSARWPVSMQDVAPKTGHPYLYASISNGGIKLARLKALIKHHRSDVRSWHTPLLIAVPEEGELRAYLRSTDAKARALFDQVDRHAPQPNKPFHPAVELLIVSRESPAST